MKQKIAAVRMPGRAIGTTMSHMILSRLAPSMMAASSVSIGIASMKPLIVQIA